MAVKFLTKALIIIHKVFTSRRVTIHASHILLWMADYLSLRVRDDLVSSVVLLDFALASSRPLKVSQSIRIIPRSILMTATLTP
jgi:hypothetical protein